MCRRFIENKYLRRGVLLIFLAAVSLFVIMQSTQNPWSIRVPSGDVNQWFSMAIDMKQGGTLYVDVVDHKGPLLFMIFCAGISLTPHSTLGVWLLEWLWWVITFFLFYKTARLYTQPVTAALAVLLTVEPVQYFFQAGSLVEAWALPFISASLFIFVKYLKSGVFRRAEVCVTGAAMTCAFMLNGNLISVWAFFVPFILVRLLIKKDFKTLGRCALWFMLGMSGAALLFAMWLYLFSSISGFFKWQILYNADTIFQHGSIYHLYSLIMRFTYASSYFVWLHLLALCIIVRRKSYMDLALFAYTGVTLLLVNTSGRDFAHYGIQLIPCALLPAAICMEALYRFWGNKKGVIVSALVFLLLWGRFDVEKFAENIRWTMDESSPWREHATYGYSDYQNVNRWIWQYDDEELRGKVCGIDEDNPNDLGFKMQNR